MRSPLVDHWWIYRPDGGKIGGDMLFGDAGTADEPDWVWADEDTHDPDEPVTYVCERFVGRPYRGERFVGDPYRGGIWIHETRERIYPRGDEA